MRQHGHAAGGPEPTDHDIQLRPGHRAGRWSALAEIAVECLVKIADASAVDQKFREVRTTRRRTTGIEQRGLE